MKKKVTRITFHVSINRGPEQTIETRTGQYQLAALAALALLKYKEDDECDIVKIWVPELVARKPDPDTHVQSYGPYFYAYDGHKVWHLLRNQEEFKW